MGRGREAEKERIRKEEYETFLKNTYEYVDSRMRALRRKQLQKIELYPECNEFHQYEGQK